MEKHPGGESATRSLISLAGLAPPGRVIDLGAGDGDGVRLLRGLGYDAIGVDISPGEGVEYGDIFALPFAPGSFDAALSQCVFLLTGDVPRALAAAHGLLVPGGVLMYSDVVPGGEDALRALARDAGFALECVEDTTREWREYYLAAVWRGEAGLPPEGVNGCDCRYLAAVLRKERARREA